MKLKVNDKAPEFTLNNQAGEAISLKDFKGKNSVLLYFYPKAMTPGCTVQACSLRDIQKELKKRKITVLGVSIDSSARLKKFEEKEELNFNLLSDEDHKVCELYGVWGKKQNYGKEYMGILRTSFLIGTDGKIKHIFEKVNTKTHHDAVISFYDENSK
ncbi:MAG: thioredoxin-dependent thiol peroxidase [Bacteriovoracaceae bacterium]